PDDGSLPPADQGGPPGDGSLPPADQGGPPDDGSLPPADQGGPPEDGSLPPADQGGPPADGSLPPADQGGPEDLAEVPDGPTLPRDGATGPGDGALADGSPEDGGADGSADGGLPGVVIRTMAANLTSGNYQRYDPGHGIRIFQGLRPDIVLIQEFSYEDSTARDLREFVDTAFGSDFEYFREPTGSIPNGVISRYPILGAGSWDDALAPDRGFAWAWLDVPGEQDLWVVSIHLLTASSTKRDQEAAQLVDLIQQHVPEEDLLLVGGDLNTDVRGELCLETFGLLLDVAPPWPVDGAGNGNTNRSRARPYDWLLADADLEARETPVRIGEASFPHGLVFDSRVYEPLTDVHPVLRTDSDAVNMQHQAVVRDFLLPAD
ncbi:MAG: endonuclease, partial [Myxococcota bacterium]|nr:endonuclease [Myxococcota bacterium]